MRKRKRLRVRQKDREQKQEWRRRDKKRKRYWEKQWKGRSLRKRCYIEGGEREEAKKNKQAKTLRRPRYLETPGKSGKPRKGRVRGMAAEKDGETERMGPEREKEDQGV